MVKVKFIKSHPAFGYFDGETGTISEAWAEKLLPKGYIIILPETESTSTPGADASPAPIPDPAPVVNPLPEDLPGREKLFAAGFTEVAKVKEAGDGLLDAGISNAMLKKITKYLKTI